MPFANGQYKSPEWFTHFLDTNGNQTGSIDATGDYSVTPETFFIQPPSDEIYILHRMIGAVHDNGNFASSTYGAGLALTNGVVIKIKRNGVDLIDLTNGHPIKTNGSFPDYCYDVDISNFTGNDNFLHFRWTFSRAGEPLVLNGSSSDTFEVILNDDFTFLTEHLFTIQGYS